MSDKNCKDIVYKLQSVTKLSLYSYQDVLEKIDDYTIVRLLVVLNHQKTYFILNVENGRY